MTDSQSSEEIDRIRRTFRKHPVVSKTAVVFISMVVGSMLLAPLVFEFGKFIQQFPSDFLRFAGANFVADPYTFGGSLGFAISLLAINGHLQKWGVF